MSALVDGQLDDAEAERAWAHVHACAACFDAVEREGWVKSQLMGWKSAQTPPAPTFPPAFAQAVGAYASDNPVDAPTFSVRRAAALMMVGGGAVGVAVVGVLALGAAPADAPSINREAPVTRFGPVSDDPTPVFFDQP